MGLWASMSTALIYGFFILAGIQNGLSRELPYYFGADDETMAHNLASTTLFYTLCASGLVLASGACSVVFLVWKHADPKVMYTAAAITLLMIVKFYQNYLFLTYRSKNSFVSLSRVQVKQAVLTFLTLPLLLVMGYGGLVARSAILGAVGLYWMHTTRPLSVRPSWSTASFLLLLRTGMPIFVTDYITNCAGTLDKVALLRFGGLESVGLYSLAISASSALAVIPQSIAHYVYPRMSHHYGRTNDPRILWVLARKTTLIVTATMIPIAIGGCLLLPASIRLLFPKYVAGTHAAQIALFTAVACGATTGANALASLKAWSYLIAYQLSYAGLLAIGPFAGIHFLGSPLRGVAYGMLAANILGAILALIFTFAATHQRCDRTDLAFTGPVKPASENLAVAK